ncbi:MAG: ParB/RepB/Spo0J family partition protein [Myxococcota bacterium]|nr:ParB/RepB/Spo0J family partition protein [Myxococcota bacterium]
MSAPTGKGRRALGKGLGALIPGADAAPGASSAKEYFLCPVERIHPQPNQPRQKVGEAALKELVKSIQEQGIIQPLVVRRRTNGDGYELIAGERRWRAAQLAGFKDLPVCVKEATHKEAFEMALVENIQREDLNPIEEAEAFKRLIDEHGYTQSELSSRIGRDRSTIANSLRLLGLPPEVQAMVNAGNLTEGHARAILQVGNNQQMIVLARSVAAKGYSVRETERRARSAASTSKGKREPSAKTGSVETRALVERLQRALNTRVNIVDNKGKGRLEIIYTSYDELDGILNKILR